MAAESSRMYWWRSNVSREKEEKLDWSERSYMESKKYILSTITVNEKKNKLPQGILSGLLMLTWSERALFQLQL